MASRSAGAVSSSEPELLLRTERRSSEGRSVTEQHPRDVSMISFAVSVRWLFLGVDLSVGDAVVFLRVLSYLVSRIGHSGSWSCPYRRRPTGAVMIFVRECPA